MSDGATYATDSNPYVFVGSSHFMNYVHFGANSSTVSCTVGSSPWWMKSIPTSWGTPCPTFLSSCYSIGIHLVRQAGSWSISNFLIISSDTGVDLWGNDITQETLRVSCRTNIAVLRAWCEQHWFNTALLRRKVAMVEAPVVRTDRGGLQGGENPGQQHHNWRSRNKHQHVKNVGSRRISPRRQHRAGVIIVC